MKKIIVTIIIVVVIGVSIGIGTYYFYLSDNNKQENFSSVKAKMGRLEEFLEIEAEVASREKESLTFRDGDKVKEIKFQLGDKVNQDDVLIVFENGTELKAPYGGTIIDLLAYPGQKKEEIQAQTQNPPSQVMSQASPKSQNGADLITIAKMDELDFTTKIDEDQIEQIKKDQEVRLNCDINKEVTIYGKVEKVGLTLKTGSDGNGYFEVKGKINDLKELNPRDGMSCDGEVVLEVKDNVLTIADSAVLFEDDKTFVYLYDPNSESATKKKIEIGIEGKNSYEVIDGLDEGEEVIENAEDYAAK